MFKPSVSKMYFVVSALLLIGLIVINVQSFILLGNLSLLSAICACIFVLGITLQSINTIKGVFVFEEDFLIIKDAFDKKEIPYNQIRHISTTPTKGVMKFLTGVKGFVIELDLGRENPRVITTNDQEGFLAELNKRRRGGANEQNNIQTQEEVGN